MSNNGHLSECGPAIRGTARALGILAAAQVVAWGLFIGESYSFHGRMPHIVRELLQTNPAEPCQKRNWSCDPQPR